MNIDNITAKIQHLQLLKNLHSLADIENYTDYLLKFIDQLIKNIVS